MTYQMYRSTTLGETLQRSLDELIADGQITQQLAARVTTTFDKCINNALSTRARNKTGFKVGFFLNLLNFLGRKITRLSFLRQRLDFCNGKR